jgi:hypothetical protein
MKVSRKSISKQRDPYFMPCTGSVDRLCGLIEFLATDPEVQVRLPALPDFLRSSYLEEKIAAPV